MIGSLSLSTSLVLRPSGGGGGWTPAKLFENGELGVWYDPSDLSTLFRDTAGTVPVTADGQTVGLMRDKSGNGLDLTQAISSARPKWIEASPHLQFDGVDDRLFRSVFSETVTSMGLAIVSQQGGPSAIDVFFLEPKIRRKTAFRLWLISPELM